MSEITVNENQSKVAVLIDAENVSADLADLIFTNAAACGTVLVREIYGTATALTSWIEPTLKYAIHPNLTVKASKSKNSSDISLVIGAMDLLSYREITTMIIVSSDSDFSTLSVRLRADGINVIGMGAEKANPLWRTACSSFIALNEKKMVSMAIPTMKATAPKAAQQPAAPAHAAPTANAQSSGQTPAPAKRQTHEERLENIRNYITGLLKAENGRMSMTRLFQSLNKFHDYQVDQAGSRRRPLNYLQWAFSNSFFFEETPNGMMISLEPAPPAQNSPAKMESAETVKADAATAQADSAAQQAEEKLESAETVKADAAMIPADLAAQQAEEKLESAETAKTDAATAQADLAAQQADEESAVTVETSAPDKAGQSKKGKKPAANRQAKNNQSRGKKAPEAKTKDEKQSKPKDQAPVSEAGRMFVTEVKAIPARIRKALIAAGRITLHDAAQISDEELQKIPQVGAATIAAFRKTVNEILGQDSAK